MSQGRKLGFDVDAGPGFNGSHLPADLFSLGGRVIDAGAYICEQYLKRDTTRYV